LAAAVTAVDDRHLRPRRFRRGRHVDRLFEERPVEGVRLVEDRHRTQAAAVIRPSTAELAPFDESLDDDRFVNLAALAADNQAPSSASAAG
jgi:hypothetical protein